MSNMVAGVHRITISLKVGNKIIINFIQEGIGMKDFQTKLKKCMTMRWVVTNMIIMMIMDLS